MSDHRTIILIVEDDLGLQAYFDMALKCLGYKTEVANDGVEALECLQSAGGTVAAVLLDFVMPTKDGVATLRDIRQLYPDLPVIMFSGAPSPLNIVASMKSGATDF